MCARGRVLSVFGLDSFVFVAVVALCYHRCSESRNEGFARVDVFCSLLDDRKRNVAHILAMLYSLSFVFCCWLLTACSIAILFLSLSLSNKLRLISIKDHGKIIFVRNSLPHDVRVIILLLLLYSLHLCCFVSSSFASCSLLYMR